MPPEPRKRTRTSRPEITGGATEPLPIETGRRRRNTAAAPRAQKGRVVDFAGAALRAADRAERVKRLKEQVQGGAYSADPLETARAMERRSDA